VAREKLKIYNEKVKVEFIEYGGGMDILHSAVGKEPDFARDMLSAA